ncbi:MAG: efflux RND transporter permease subunit [Alphaproteobacteria bacterium GM202ARS2]|nr:efflux RND transporter permease subunit [Alphaproteobacteria bacterium GM202ARS2]
MSVLTQVGLENSRVTVLVMLIILAVGCISYLNFPKREDPAITVRTAVVVAQNTGLTSAQLEEFIAAPIEEAVRAIAGVSEVRTQITGGAAIIQIDIKDEVPERDIKRVFDEIRDDVGALTQRMPQGTVGPVVDTNFGDVAAATIAVTGRGFSLAEIDDAATKLRDRLYALKEVSAATLYGAQHEVITLEVDRDRLAAMGATINPIVAALQGQNVRLPAGSLETANTRIPLRATGDLRTSDDIENLLIEIPKLGLIRLGDLVNVRRGYQDPPQTPIYQDGHPAVLVAVEMADGVDITALGPKLKNVVDKFRADQPIGIDAHFSTFQPDVVTASVNGALINMAQTFVVVLLVMLVFVGWREALIIASIVPLSVSFAFAWMGPFGVELQQVSIAAIIISLGLLVDNGLVIIEDMQRRIRSGQSREAAALAAGSQYTLPLLIASTTTVAAFLPLFLLHGTEGQYGYSLGAVVMLMLVGSFLSALYLLPRLAVWTLPQPKAESSERTMFDVFADGYGAVVAWSIQRPLVVVFGSAALIVLGGSQMGNVPNQMFPLSERPQFLVYMDLPRGTDIKETRKQAVRFSNWLKARGDDVVSVTAFVGSGGPRFVLSLDPADADPSSAFMVVNTKNFDTSTRLIEASRHHVLQAFPNAEFRMKRLAMGGREPGVDIKIAGPDGKRLLHAAHEVQSAFASAPGIVQNRNDWGPRILEGQINIAQDRLRAYGLTSQDVSNALKGYFDGTQISVFRDGDKEVPIVLRGTPEDRKSYEAIANAIVEANGQPLSLDQFSKLRPSLEFSSLRRVDQRRTITVSTISDAMTAFALYDHIKPTLKKLSNDLGPAYRITVGGEIENSAEVRQKLGGGLPIALAVMLIALMIQFNSFRRVAVTLLSVPLVIVGVPVALLATGQPLSFFGTLGLIALSGIIINNAIVLIDQIDIEQKDKSRNDAIVAAAKKRFRPILLTSLTTVVGLMPMALTGGALWEPMATLMIGGLGFASVLTLFWVPALYRLFFQDSTGTADVSGGFAVER